MSHWPLLALFMPLNNRDLPPLLSASLKKCMYAGQGVSLPPSILWGCQKFVLSSRTKRIKVC